MIGVPVNSNSIHVPIIQTGCCKGEFDSTYPVHLNGIINQYEFQESMKKINLAFSYMKNFLIVAVVLFVFAMVVGTICFVVGGLMAVKSRLIFYALLSTGVFLSTFGSIFFSIGIYLVNSKRMKRLRETIAEESMKYSMRSPTPCSWRLDVLRTWGGAYGSYNNRFVYQLVIDIGGSAAQSNIRGPHYSNVIAPVTVSSYERRDNYAPPPYETVTSAFCFQCGAARADLTAKFCSSCGHSFQK